MHEGKYDVLDCCIGLDFPRQSTRTNYLPLRRHFSSSARFLGFDFVGSLLVGNPPHRAGALSSFLLVGTLLVKPRQGYLPQ
jgi:hypothetical protein